MPTLDLYRPPPPLLPSVIAPVNDERREGLANGENVRNMEAGSDSEAQPEFSPLLFINNLPNSPIGLLVCRQYHSRLDDCL
jgi:hypothetical protein